MFDFEKLEVYKIAKAYNKEVRVLIKLIPDKVIRDQLSRASMSISLNIAEGCGRFSKADRKNFYIISRSSVFECVALFEILKDENVIDKIQYQHFYSQSENISKILYTLIIQLQS